MVSFFKIAFVVVKLKICVLIQHPWNGLFWEVFGPLLPQIWSNIAEVLARGSTLSNESIVWKKLEGFEFSWKRDGPKVCTLIQLWPLVSPWRWRKSKKISISGEKLQSLDYPNMSKLRLYHLSLFQKNMITFCIVRAIFTRKQGRVTNQRVRIKI